MASTPFDLTTDYASIQYVSAKDLNRRAKVQAVQLGGLLQTIGAGVAYDPTNQFNSLLVELDTGATVVRQGQGYVADANGNIYWFRTEEDTVISPIASTLCYVYAEYIEPAADVANPDTAAVDDTDTTGIVNIVVDVSDSLANAIQIASIGADGTITDTRDFVRWDLTSNEIANLQMWLGYNSSIYDTKSTVEARLEALETPEGGASVVTLLSQLKISASDDRNAATVLLDLESRIASLESGQGGTRPAITDTDQITTELAITRQGVIALQPDEGERSRSANIEATVDGTYGIGTSGYPDNLDYTNATINDDGEFEV